MNLDSPEPESDVPRQAAFHRALLDAQSELGQGIAIVDRKAKRFVHANDALCRLLGYGLTQLLALESYYDLLPADQLAVLAARQKDGEEGARLLTGLELEVLRRDGTSVSVELSAKPLSELPGDRLLVLVRDVTERRRAESAVRRLADIVESSDDAIMSADTHGRITSWNRSAEHTIGYAPTDVLGREVGMLVPPGVADAARRTVRVVVRGKSLQSFETTGLAKDGRLLDFSVSVFPVRDSAGEVVGISVIARDVGERLAAERERAELEARLRQSERLETVGLLAGGIAHDFNNLLAVILNYADFMRKELEGDDRVTEDLEEIRGAAERAAALTRQLLAFSRREIVAPEILDLNEVVGETERLLGRMIGEDIDLQSQLSPDPWPIKADRGQIEQIVMNLVINARDAMSGRGGSVRIETANARVGRGAVPEATGPPPGHYVRLTVVDDGRGMDEAQRLRAFEPFFSTKPRDEGSGLGLATVYGIAQQAGGHVALESKPGRGSTVTVHLPATEDVREDGPGVDRAIPSRGSGQTILLVEDDDSVRGVARRILTEAGYVVVEAREYGAALELFEDSIDLLLTDVVLPGMPGTELARLMLADHPWLRLLYISGYTDDVVLRAGVEKGSVPFVQKPFTAELLRDRVQAVLEGESRGAEVGTSGGQVSG